MEEGLCLLKNPIEQLKSLLQRLERNQRSQKAVSSKDQLLSPRFPSKSVAKDPGTPQNSKAKSQRSLSQFWSVKEPIKNYTKKLKSIFQKLYNQYSDTDWVRKFEKQKYLHIAIVQQFWLDSYLCLDITRKKLIAPIKRKTWVDFQNFVRSMEGIHIRQSISFLFFNISSSPQLKIAKRIQKMLFYFTISSNGEKKLPNEKIMKVLLLARRSKQTWTIAKSTLRAIVEHNRAKHSYDEIHFEDFKDIITSIDN